MSIFAYTVATFTWQFFTQWLYLHRRCSLKHSRCTLLQSNFSHNVYIYILSGHIYIENVHFNIAHFRFYNVEWQYWLYLHVIKSCLSKTETKIVRFSLLLVIQFLHLARQVVIFAKWLLPKSSKAVIFSTSDTWSIQNMRYHQFDSSQMNHSKVVSLL